MRPVIADKKGRGGHREETALVKAGGVREKCEVFRPVALPAIVLRLYSQAGDHIPGRLAGHR